MYTYSRIILKIARKINKNVEFPGFSRSFIRLSVSPHWKLRMKRTIFETAFPMSFRNVETVFFDNAMPG